MQILMDPRDGQWELPSGLWDLEQPVAVMNVSSKFMHLWICNIGRLFYAYPYYLNQLHWKSWENNSSNVLESFMLAGRIVFLVKF